MKPVIRITIALGLMALSLAGCGSLLPKPTPSSSKIFVLFSPLRRQSVKIWIALGRFPSESVR